MALIWLFPFMNWGNVFRQSQLFGETFFTRWALVGSVSFIENIWLHGLSIFTKGIHKSIRFFPKNQHTQRKLLYYFMWQKVKKSDFQSKFPISRIQSGFPKYNNLGAYFLLLTSYDNFNFWNTLTKIMYDLPISFWHVDFWLKNC